MVMQKTRFNALAKLVWVLLLAVCVALYAFQQRRTHDSPPEFRKLTQKEMVGDLVDLAEQSGIDDLSGFQRCLAGDEAAKSVRADFEHGIALEITGVPALVVGNRLVMGSISEAEIQEWLR